MNAGWPDSRAQAVHYYTVLFLAGRKWGSGHTQGHWIRLLLLISKDRDENQIANCWLQGDFPPLSPSALPQLLYLTTVVGRVVYTFSHSLPPGHMVYLHFLIPLQHKQGHVTCTGQWNTSEGAMHHFQAGAFICQCPTVQQPLTPVVILEALGEMKPLSAWVPDCLQGAEPLLNPHWTGNRNEKQTIVLWSLWDLRGCLLPWHNLAYPGWSSDSSSSALEGLIYAVGMPASSSVCGKNVPVFRYPS